MPEQHARQWKQWISWFMAICTVSNTQLMEIPLFIPKPVFETEKVVSEKLQKLVLIRFLLMIIYELVNIFLKITGSAHKLLVTD